MCLRTPVTSTRRRSQELNIPRTSFRRILHKDLGMTVYKIQLIQELKPGDHQMRLRFAEWTNARLQEHPNFIEKSCFPMKFIFFSVAM